LLKEAAERGDRYAATNLHARFASTICWLRDDPESAIADLHQSIEQWSRRQFYVQHYWEMIGLAEIDIYQLRGQAAYERVVKSWSALRRSLLISQVQVALIESLHLRARCAIAAALTTADSSLLRDAERAVERIERENMAWGNALALL